MSLAGTLGITSSAMFFGANLCMSFATVPVLLLPTPASPLPPPANATNAASPTSTASVKPEAKPPLIARQWQKLYDIGSRAGPVLAVLASGPWLYAARTLPASARVQQRLFLVAAGLSLSIAPFTFTIMRATNNELHRRAYAANHGDEEDSNDDAEKGTVKGTSTHDLLRWWATLNFLRALIHAGAMGCAITAVHM